MTGWIVLASIGLAIGLTLGSAGIARSIWAFVGAALLLGASGYMLQGHAGLAGRPAIADADPVAIDPAATALRDAMFGQFSGDGAYLIASDALMRRGSRVTGTNVVLLGLNHYPRSLMLWTGYGTALAQHDGTVSPAAKLAFDQATRLAAAHPAPPYFRGLAYAEAGDLGAARRYWLRALALAPPKASYRREIAEQIAALDGAMAQ